MGCWSERCALTGLEIGCGQHVYVACIAESADEFYGPSIATPPVKGTYDDYGGIDLLEDAEIMGMKKGQNWRPDDEDAEKPSFVRGATLKPVFIHAEIFEKIANIRPEFDYTVATVGRSVNERIAKLQNLVQDIKDLEGDEEDTKPLRKAHAALRREFSWPETWTGSQELLEDLIDAGKSTDEFFDLYRRLLLLKSAEHELRQPLVSSRVGPQHGGEMALRQVNDWVSEILDAKDENRREDSGHHDYASGHVFELPFKMSEPVEGQIEITSEDGKLLWATVAPEESDPHRRDTEIGRRRAFAGWMVAKLNA